MGRIAIFDTGYQTVSVVQDLLEVLLTSGQCAVLHSAKVMQSSDEGASEAELLQINVKKGIGNTSGSGGGTATEVKLATGQAAAGVTGKERNNTTQAVAGGGSLETVWPGSFNVLAGEWEFTPTPEIRPVFGPSEACILSLDEAPADALTLRAVMYLEIIVG